MRYVKPGQARVTYYNAEGKTIEAREYPTKDMGGYSVVDTSEPPEGAAHQRSQGVYTIDPLGAETPAMRAERKAAERKPNLGIAHVLGVSVAFVLIAGLFAVVGMFIGASDPDAVHDLLPSGSPSGERAEPEESAR